MKSFFKLFTNFPFILFIMIIFISIFNLFQKEKSKKEEISERKEQPHIIENQYSDPFGGRSLIVKSINTSASAVSTFNDFLDREL